MQVSYKFLQEIPVMDIEKYAIYWTKKPKNMQKKIGENFGPRNTGQNAKFFKSKNSQPQTEKSLGKNAKTTTFSTAQNYKNSVCPRPSNWRRVHHMLAVGVWPHLRPVGEASWSKRADREPKYCSAPASNASRPMTSGRSRSCD